MDKGFFGMLFDLDGNGELDSFERACDLGTFVSMLEEEEKKEFFDDTGLDTDDFE
ncbi:MAG: hypothetical protein IKU52_01745 [Clostridia bacterium]|nr:hypothetical protein [Clostridia bacterium]